MLRRFVSASEHSGFRAECACYWAEDTGRRVLFTAGDNRVVKSSGSGAFSFSPVIVGQGAIW
jgi:hypothetical protein